MAIVSVPITDRAQWLELRKPNVGASEVGALFGIHDYLTGFALAAKKLGKLTDEPDNATLERGRDLEPIAAKKLKRIRPDLQQEAAEHYFFDPEIHFGATPDLFVFDQGDRRGVVQIKTVMPGEFARKWHGEAGTIVPPLWIALQAMSEQHLTESEFAIVAALVLDTDLPLHVVEVPYMPKLMAEARAKVVSFWQMIGRGELPEPDYCQDGKAIKAVFARDDGGELDLTSDNELPEIVDQLEALKMARKTADDGIEEAQNRILHRLGNAQSARYAGGLITAKTEHRKAYQVAESTRRPLRIKHDRERAA
jgi:YqaJ-like viral recombinase domain